jgi:hypothetical protein
LETGGVRCSRSCPASDSFLESGGADRAGLPSGDMTRRRTVRFRWSTSWPGILELVPKCSLTGASSCHPGIGVKKAEVVNF